MARIFRTGRQRAASRRNLIKARRVRSVDTLGHWARAGIRAAAGAASGGYAGPVSNFIEGKKNNRPSKWSKLYKDRSKKRKRRKKR